MSDQNIDLTSRFEAEAELTEEIRRLTERRAELRQEIAELACPFLVGDKISTPPHSWARGRFNTIPKLWVIERIAFDPFARDRSGSGFKLFCRNVKQNGDVGLRTEWLGQWGEDINATRVLK